MVQAGDAIPTVELEEGGPGNKVNLATELASGSGIIIGVPAAFSMSCLKDTSHNPLLLTPPRPHLLRLPHSGLHQPPQALRRWQGLCCLRQRPLRVRPLPPLAKRLLTPSSTTAWGKSLDSGKTSGVRFLSDASGAFTRALDVEFPAAAFLGTNRSKRYALVVEGGKVKSVHIEPDNIGADGEFVLSLNMKGDADFRMC